MVNALLMCGAGLVATAGISVLWAIWAACVWVCRRF